MNASYHNKTHCINEHIFYDVIKIIHTWTKNHPLSVSILLDFLEESKVV